MTEKVKVFLLAASLGVAMFALSGCSEADWKAIGQTLDELAAQGREIRLQREAKEREREAKKREIQRQYELEINELAKKVSAAIEPTTPIVRDYAVNLAKKYPGPYSVAQICAIWYHLKENWRYVNDPRSKEYLAPASETIKVGLAGDCDDFAILMASLIEAIGGSARVVIAQGKSGAHAYCEVYMASNEQGSQVVINSIATRDFFKKLFSELRIVSNHRFHYHKDSAGGCWLNLDWGADYPGGAFFEATRQIFIYADGTWE